MNKLIRRTHMYLALFLAPWVLMYAISTLAMNHREAFVTWYGNSRPTWEVERTLDYTRDMSGADRNAVARQILADLELDGRHDVRGSLTNGELTIIRQEPLTLRRIKYDLTKKSLTVEREAVQVHSLLNRLHGRRGYNQPYRVEKLWALSVDVVIVAMLFWSVSGLWLWWTLKKARMIGGICLAGGVSLFAFFLYSI